MSFGYAGLKAMSNIPSWVFNASISRALQQKGIWSFQQAAELRDCVIRILEAEAPGVIPDIESDDTLTKYIKYMPMVGMWGTYTAAIVDASQICIDKTMKTLTDRQDFVW